MHHPSQIRTSKSPIRLLPTLLILLPILLMAANAQALLKLDFEQRYFQHKDRQVWDFSIVRPDSVYHIFYHTIHEDTPQAAYADTIWHSTSKDMKHWEIEGPILTSGQGYWDEGAIWAPDVFFDDASGLWKIAYTGCDTHMNQRICMAESPDLYTWTKDPNNPIIEADPDVYIWDENEYWSNFRDPYVYRDNDQWNILVTALQWQGQNTGVLYHGVSDDLVNWTDVGVIYSNDGEDPWRVPESPQYKFNNGQHYLFFGEYDTGGLSYITSRQTANWTMDNRVVFDNGYAPEVDEFDPDLFIISRLANLRHPQTDVMSYAVRIDTLVYNNDFTISVKRTPPLKDNWAEFTGISCAANPTYGDNPTFRGDASVGMVGNSYFGSAEYYQGPLSGRGSPGTKIGNAARGYLISNPFIVTGDRMELLVGGGNYPETCYIAMVDAATDEIIYKETGNNQALMSPRTWDLRPYQGQTFYIKIDDQETGDMGYINVDEIIEIIDPLSAVQTPDPRLILTDHHASPNPFNPITRISFAMTSDQTVNVRIHDIRGREVWSSGNFLASTGENAVTWQGVDQSGKTAPAGTYLYSIETRGTIAASGKLSLVK